MPRILFFLLLTVLTGAPCFSADAKSKPATTTTASHANVTDAQLDSAIRTKLAKSKIGKDGFRFHVLHGVVTWDGNTEVGQHKGAATRMARSSGATQVVNNIQVSGTGQGKSGMALRKATVQ